MTQTQIGIAKNDYCNCFACTIGDQAVYIVDVLCTLTFHKFQCTAVLRLSVCFIPALP